MRIRFVIAICLAAILITAFVSWHRASASTAPVGTLLITTGVYSGFCKESVLSGSSVALYGLGNSNDPTCDQYAPSFVALPVSSNGYMANLAVVSEEGLQTNIGPTTIALYVDGHPTLLTCTVTTSVPNCSDPTHKVSVNPSDTFNVIATCPPNTNNCAQGLQVTLDRQQRAP